MNAAIADSDSPTLVTRNRPLVLTGIMLVTLCQMLDATIANVALPHMRTQLGASSDQISWVLTSFLIAQAIGTPITGWLSDRFGSRGLFLWATTAFLVASAACGAATSLTMMIACRALQGIAAAFLGPLAQTAIFDITQPSQHAKAIAVFGTISMVAPITGPTLGGLLTEYLNWRWIFYVNLPLGIPALFLLWWLLPSRPVNQRKLDIFGFSMIALGLGALQLALDRGQQRDWLESWEIICEFIIAASAIWIFVIHTRNTSNPLFHRSLFSNKPFLFGLMFMVTMSIAVVGLAATLPMLFQSLFGYSVVDTGLLLAPRGMGVIFTSMLMGWLIRYIDYRWALFLGFLLAAYGMWMMMGWSLTMEKSSVYLPIVIQGLGMGIVFSPMNMLAFSTMPARDRPDGASLLALSRSLGGSIGVSIIVTMLSRNQQVSHADIGAHVTSSMIPGFDLADVIHRLGSAGAGVMAMIDGEVNRQAMMISFLDSFVMMAIMTLIMAPLPFLLGKDIPVGGGKPAPVVD